MERVNCGDPKSISKNEMTKVFVLFFNLAQTTRIICIYILKNDDDVNDTQKLHFCISHVIFALRALYHKPSTMHTRPLKHTHDFASTCFKK